jgi:hypothetical protein
MLLGRRMRRECYRPSGRGRGAFGRYKEEQEKAVRRPMPAEDPVLRAFKRAWASLEFFPGALCKQVWQVGDLLSGVDYSAADVERFSIAMAALQDDEDFSHKAGIFLSGLINSGKDKDFRVFADHLEYGIRYLGALTSKNMVVHGGYHIELGYAKPGGFIRVIGYGGSSIGSGMKGGQIIVEGDCGQMVGCDMVGGTITVKGDVGDSAGIKMSESYPDARSTIIVEGNAGKKAGMIMHGGVLRIGGDCGEKTGDAMRGGEIHISGELGGIGDVQFGKIYHKGQLIVEEKSPWE